jgi:hypothetical protein
MVGGRRTNRVAPETKSGGEKEAKRSARQELFSTKADAERPVKRSDQILRTRTRPKTQSTARREKERRHESEGSAKQGSHHLRHLFPPLSERLSFPTLDPVLVFAGIIGPETMTIMTQ